MILLHKSGDKYQVSNYRPITLVDVIYKIYATILTQRLNDFVETNNFLHNSQSAFRPDRGTSHKLLAIKVFLKHAQNAACEAHIVSIDIKKAFDSIEHWIIRRALGPAGINVPQHFADAVMDTLTSTSLEVKVADGLSDQWQSAEESGREILSPRCSLT